MSREEVRELANGRIPPPQVTALPGQPIRRGAELTFKELDEELPASVREELGRALEQDTEVKEVYAFLMRQDEEPPEFTVAVVFYTFDPEAARPSMDKIAAVLKPWSTPGEPMSVIPLEAGSDPARDLGEIIPAIYQRRVL